MPQRVRSATITAVLASLVSALAIAPSAESQSPKPGKAVIDEIEKAWKARRARFESAEMSWESKETYIKGCFSSNFPARLGTTTGTQPDRDVTFDVPSEFSLSGNKARYGYSGYQWHMNDGRFNAVKFVSTFDGIATRECYPERAEKETYPLGLIYTRGAFAPARGAALRPVVLFFRPQEGEFYGVALPEYSLGNAASKVQDATCLEIHQKNRQSALHLWIDPARGHVVLKQLILSRNIPSQLTEIRYRQDSAHGWVPTSWDISYMGNSGKVYQTNRVTVTSLRGNEKPPRNHFDYQFPAGTKVSDELAQRRWIVRADGTKRVLGPADRLTPYDDLLRDQQAGVSGGGFAWWVKLVCAAAGIGCVIAFLWRVRRAMRLRNNS